MSNSQPCHAQPMISPAREYSTSPGTRACKAHQIRRVPVPVGVIAREEQPIHADLLDRPRQVLGPVRFLDGLRAEIDVLADILRRLARQVRNLAVKQIERAIEPPHQRRYPAKT